jgi:dihydroorotase
LRTTEDRKALKKAVLDGIIDCIASHHIPQDIDSKIVEFEYAKDGMIGLQTTFPIIRTILPELSLERLIELFSINPAKMFNLPHYDIKPNEKACLSLFAPDEPFTLTYTNILSKSKNTPFVDQKLIGKPLGVINKEKLFLSKELEREKQ